MQAFIVLAQHYMETTRNYCYYSVSLDRSYFSKDLMYEGYFFKVLSVTKFEPKTIEPAVKCGVRAVIQFLYLEQVTRNVILRYCPSTRQCLAAYCKLQQRGS